MGLYLIRRVGEAVVALIGITLAAFLLIHAVPGNPARAILGPHATPAALAAMQRQLGLDRSLPAQYWTFLTHALELNFGISTSEHVGVAGLIWGVLGPTLLLTAYATILSVIIATPLAVISALKRNRFPDHAVRLLTMITFAMPTFWLSLVLILILAVEVPVFPTAGYGSGFVGHLYHLTLPALALALGLAPLVLRTLRGSLIETMLSEFVEAARARGLGRVRIFLRYTIRNSVIAPLTVLGVNIAYLLGVVVVVENIFVLPGLGQLLVTAVQNRDFPVVTGVILVLGAIIVVVNLVTDLTYSVVDPRIKR